MTISLTDAARWAAMAPTKQPNIVLQIDGVGNFYGNIIIKKAAKIGQDDLVIGDPELDSDAFYIGGLAKIQNQENALMIEGTTTQIRQMLQIDIGSGSSISTMQIALIDTGSITKLITPGEMIDDILQTRCKVYLGFSDVAFPDDYVVVFRGVVTDVTSDAGKVVLTLNHPDDKKQGATFTQVQTNTVGAINNSVATITLATVANVLAPVLGPDGTIDPSFIAAMKIDDEIVRFTGISGNTITGCTRGYLGTTAAAHDDQASAQTFYRLIGNPIDLALKIMSSRGDATNYLDGLAATSFVKVDATLFANALYFQQVNVIDQYNVEIGDWVTTSGATHGANNVTLKQIIDIVETSTGTYLVIDGVTFVEEDTTSAVVSFRSQYDTLPDGIALINDEIDIDEHIRLRNLFLSDIVFDIYLKDTVDDTRKFIETELYSAIACFSLPRKSRCSLGYHVGPIPGQQIQTFDFSNIKTPSRMKLVRSTNRQFYNEIVYRYDEDVSTTDFLAGLITISETSKAQIKGYDKTLTVSSKGLRSTLNGAFIALVQSNARLKRYQFAAEVLSFSTLFGDGFNVEIGDIIWVDGSQLQLPDIKTGVKGMAGRFFFVQNKQINFKNGDVQLDCIDTHFDATGRYGLMSPSSIVLSGISPTNFTIQGSFSKRFKDAEHKKWANLIGCKIRLRTPDGATLGECSLLGATSNSIVTSPLPFTPSTGMIMEFVVYDDQTLANAILAYVASRDTDFPDGKKQFIML